MKHLSVMILLSFVGFIASCSTAVSSPLRIASSPWPGYEPLYLARDLGLIDNDKVHLFELPSSDITMESFRNRSTDLATLTLDETLSLIHDDVKLKVLLVMDISHGGDAVLARPDIRSLADMKGKRISIVNIPLGLYMLSRLLEKAELSIDDVTVFPMPESRQLSHYLSGKSDVVITFEPVKTNLLNNGAHVLFDSSQIPNEIFDLIVVHEDVYLQRKDDICSVVHSWFKTLDYIDDNNADSMKRMAKRLRVTDTEVKAMMTGIYIPGREENVAILGGNSPSIIPAANRLSKIMLAEGLLTRPVTLSGSIDPEFTGCYQ
jgi:NitT/TauT family transport system substrate-binding protein